MQNKPRKSKENNFMTLLNFIVDPAIIVDENGKFLIVNDAFMDLTGLSKKDLIGTAFLDLSLLTAESKAILLKNLKKRMQGLPVEPYEISFTDKPGKVRFAEVKAKKIDYAGRHADLVIFRDITRRKENARRLKEYSEKMEVIVNEKVKDVKKSEERYRELTESISAVFFAMDKDLRYTYWNKASEKLTGISAKDAIGKSLTEVFPNIKRTKVEQFYKEVLRTKQSQSFLNKYRFGDKNFVFEISAYPTMDGLSVFVKDITESKKAEEALKESEEKFRNLSEKSPNMIFINKQGRVVYANKKCEDLMGYTKEEFYAPTFNFFSLIAPESLKKLNSIYSTHRAGEEVTPYEYDLLTKAGKRISAVITTKLIKYEGENAILGIVTDITDRKKTEKTLLASEKKYRRLFKELKRAEKQLLAERDRAQNYLDIADVLLVALDTEDRITMLNRKGCAILKCKAKEALGKNWFDTFLPKKVKNGVKRRFKLVLSGKASFSEYHENPVLAKNGDIRLIGWHHTVLRNNDGRIIGTLSSGEDITEWKKAQQALTDSEEMFRAISTYASDAITLLDKTDKVVYWNLAAEKIFGYTKEDAIGTKLNALVVPPANHKRHLELLEKLFKNKMQISEKRTEINALRKDGTEFPIELSAKVLNLKGAQYVLEIIRDISERRKMEDELKQERDMLEAVTENIGAGLAVISEDYRILWANKLLKQINGDCEGKMCYSTFNRLTEICPDCGVKKIFENCVPIDTHEYSNQDDKGNKFWVELVVTPIKDEKGNVIAALELAVNITERKIMQNKLAEYSQKLEKLVEQRTEQLKQTQAKLVKSERLAAIGELAAMVGHDLRNPLTGIMGAAYYLKTKNSAELGAKGKEMLEAIENAINHSNKIVNDLLEYSRELKLAFIETTPKAMLQSTLSFLEVPREIQIVDATEDKPTVKADTEKMRQVFVNITKNAIDAMPQGGTLTIKSRKMKGKLTIAFKDTGTGMSEETFSNIWTPLFTTKAKGMGFGLPICRRIVEAHGGKISVESKIGKGTKVTVTIPVNPKPVNEGEEKWIFSESMLSAITATQETP